MGVGLGDVVGVSWWKWFYWNCEIELVNLLYFLDICFVFICRFNCKYYNINVLLGDRICLYFDDLELMIEIRVMVLV